MKIKIIDVFNIISKGEEAPKKIKYKNKIYEYREQEKGYYDGIYYLYFESVLNHLNDEIEIIEEEPKKIHSLEYYDNSISWCINGREITDNEKDIIDKINELIDYINEMENK